MGGKEERARRRGGKCICGKGRGRGSEGRGRGEEGEGRGWKGREGRVGTPGKILATGL